VTTISSVTQETSGVVAHRPSEPRPVRGRIAGAPISWGVSEVPGWGYQLPAGTVLEQMRELGLAATELGPDGFLETAPVARAEQLAAYGMRAVGGFLPVLLHDPSHDPMPEVDRFLDGCIACGGGVVVLAAFTGVDGYDARPTLDDAGWTTLLGNLDRISDHARSRGVIAALHPHVGTMVETGEETERVLSGSRVGLCVDTGHLLVGGGDPVAITAAHPERVEHVHLKDVDAAMAARVRAGETTFGAAVRDGMFRPLGTGDVDVSALVRTLEEAGYDGWYVLEQDVRLDSEAQGGAPYADVETSLAFLSEVAG
jgi:inosose dehydratase